MTAWQSCHAVLQWPLLKPLTKVFLAATILEFIGAVLLSCLLAWHVSEK
jgi:hypothetical protein